MQENYNKLEKIDYKIETIPTEEAILKNESSGNSYKIVEPCKIGVFPNYLIGIIKSFYFLNNEKYVGEGVGILIGEDVILTSAHNLIFSEIKHNGEIINYKPYKITFNILKNGIMELIKEISCNVDSIIFSEKLKEMKFEQVKVFVSILRSNRSLIGQIDENKENLKKLTNESINDQVKSKSSDMSNTTSVTRNNRKNIINNVSEISLPDDFAILFTETNIGREILELFCEEPQENNKICNLCEVENETKLFKIFEEHIEFIDYMESNDKQKFRNSKISMTSMIKYNEKLLGLPQYVYGSNFNDINTKFIKKKKERIRIENNLFEESKSSLISRDCSQNSHNNYISSNRNYNLNTNKSNKLNSLDESLNFTQYSGFDKKPKWERELNHCLLINCDKNSTRKNLRNLKMDNLKKLMVFNDEEFYLDGKSVICEAKGKLCSLIFEKKKKMSENMRTQLDKILPAQHQKNSQIYEVNFNQSTPNFNCNSNTKINYDEKKENSEEKSNDNVSFYDLYEFDPKKGSKSLINDFNCGHISQIDNLYNGEFGAFVNGENNNKSFNIIFNKNDEMRNYSFNDISGAIGGNISKINELDNPELLKDTQSGINKRFVDQIKNRKYTISTKNHVIDCNQKDHFVHESKNNLPSLSVKKQKLQFDELKKNKIGEENSTISSKQLKPDDPLNNSIKCNHKYNQELNYMITTYKGQSGSPLFIRIKNEKLIEMKKHNLINCPNDKYSYIFLGLHSRSPEHIEPIEIYNKPDVYTFQNNVFKENGKNIIDININLNEKSNNINLKINLKALLEKGDIGEINDFIIKNYNVFIKENSDILRNKKDKVIGEFVKKNNYCSYNIGLKIDKYIYHKIKDAIISHRQKKSFTQNQRNSYLCPEKELLPEISECQENDQIISSPFKLLSSSNNDNKYMIENIQDNRNEIKCENYFDESKNVIKTRERIYNKGSKYVKKIQNKISEIKRNSEISNQDNKNYFLVNIYLYDEFIVKGIFNITSRMEILFEIASKYIEIDRKYLILTNNRENHTIDGSAGQYIQKIFVDEFDYSNPINEEKTLKNNIFKQILHVNFLIDIDKYSDFISSKLFSKLNDNVKNFNENKVFDGSNEYLKIVIKYIFNEIQCFFEKSMNLHGLLFTAIKKKIVIST